MKYRGILASSSDPSGETLSKTVQGILLGGSSLIIFFGVQFFHVQITPDNVAALAAQVPVLIGGIMTVYGLALKVINSYGTV